MKKLLLAAWMFVGCAVSSGPKIAYQPVSWKQLSSFACPAKATTISLPAEVQSLDGQPVRLSGYVVPLETNGTRIQSFLLVRDQMLCCFGKAPALNEWVFVEFPKGGGLELQVDKPFEVCGHFRAREEREKGVVMSLYRLQAEKVQILQNVQPGWKAT